MFEITLVSMTQVDWAALTLASNRAINRSPTRQLDTLGIPVGIPQSYIPALADFHGKGNPATAMKDCEIYLTHVSLGFLISCDRETFHQLLIAGSDFHVVMSDPSRMKENFILTGSLLTWRRAIIVACQQEAAPESREFFNHMWELFLKLGYKDIFGQYRRKDLKDNTFALEPRK